MVVRPPYHSLVLEPVQSSAAEEAVAKACGGCWEGAIPMKRQEGGNIVACFKTQPSLGPTSTRYLNVEKGP